MPVPLVGEVGGPAEEGRAGGHVGQRAGGPHLRENPVRGRPWHDHPAPAVVSTPRQAGALFNAVAGGDGARDRVLGDRHPERGQRAVGGQAHGRLGRPPTCGESSSRLQPGARTPGERILPGGEHQRGEEDSDRGVQSRVLDEDHAST